MEVMEFVSVLRRRKTVICVPIVLGLAAAWVIHDQITPRYTGQATILLNLRTTMVAEGSEVISSLPREQAAVRTETELLQSRSMAEHVVDRLNLIDDPTFLDRQFAERPLPAFLNGLRAEFQEWWRSQFDPPAMDTPRPPPPDQRALLLDALQENVSVKSDGQSFALHLRFYSPDPIIAAMIANGFADAYLDYQRALKTQGTREAGRWLTDRVDELRAELERTDTAMEKLRRETGTLTQGGQSMAGLEITELNREVLAAEAEQRSIASRLATLREAVASRNLESSPEIMASTVVVGLRHQQAAARVQEAELLGTFGERHPALVRARTERQAIDQQLADESRRIANRLEQEEHAAAEKVSRLLEAVGRARERLRVAQNAEVEMARLERDANAGRSLYESYLLRMKQLGEREQLEMPDAVIITAARIPQAPDARRLTSLLLGMFGGGLLGAFLAFLRERMDDSLRSAGEVEQLLGLPVLGLLPNQQGWRESPEARMLSAPNSPFAEAVRATSLVVSLAGDRRTNRVIAVTSALPGEGKTTFCISVARQLASEGLRVLLVDADLRRPRVNRVLGDVPGPDLIDLMLDRCGTEEAVRTDAKTGARYLGVDTGSRHPVPLLQSGALQRIVDRARQSYDIVLIDTPPMTVAADSALIARSADACLFFVRWGVTSRQAVFRGLRLLSLCHVSVTGVVLSRIGGRQSAAYASYGPSSRGMIPTTAAVPGLLQ